MNPGTDWADREEITMTRNVPFLLAALMTVGALLAGPVLAQGTAEPSKAQRYLISGTELMNNARYLDAAEQFRLAIDEDPEMVDAYRNLAFVYSKMAESDAEYYQDALEIYEEVEILLPDDLDIKRNKAYVFTQLDEMEEAVATYEEIVGLDPTDCTSYGAMGELYRRRAETRPEGSEEYKTEMLQAVEKFSELIEACPEEVSAYNTVGEIYFKLGDLESASAIYTELLELQPDNFQAAGRMGYLWYNAGEEKRKAKDKAGSIPMYEKSLPYLARVLEIDPEQVQYRQIYANALKHAGKQGEAAAQLRMIIDNDPSQAALYCNLGFTYLDADDYETAIEMAMQAIATGAPQQDCLYAIWGKGLEGRGNAQYEAFEFSKAITTYVEAKSKFTLALGGQNFGTYAQKQIERCDQLIARATAAKAKNAQGR
jgi:tetratricopeptide (TPR) repeat protein